MGLFESEEAARAMNLSESTFRHRLRAGRIAMQERFGGLCALIGKGGVCHQCSALRDVCAEGARGPAVEPIADDSSPALDKLERRLAIVRAMEERGAPDSVHDLLYRFMRELWDGEPA